MTERDYDRDARLAASWPMWVAVVGFALLMLALVTREDGPRWESGALRDVQAQRRTLIGAAWDDADELTGGGCPTVDALERALPDLAPVDARERDYVAWLLGVRC